MAEYHEDIVEKHEITKEEILFLKELQKEMNTQDTVCQADPRFWVIEGSERVYTGAEYANNSCMIASDDGTVIADTLKEAIEYFKDNYDMDNIEILENTQYKNLHGYDIKQVRKDYDPNNPFDVSFGKYEKEADLVDDFQELIDFLEECGIIAENVYSVAYYNIESKIYQDTMFLTNKSCKEHIRLNNYHYSSDAHSYAMTAWRSPEVEKLFKILQQVDWDKML